MRVVAVARGNDYACGAARGADTYNWMSFQCSDSILEGTVDSAHGAMFLLMLNVNNDDSDGDDDGSNLFSPVEKTGFVPLLYGVVPDCDLILDDLVVCGDEDGGGGDDDDDGNDDDDGDSDDGTNDGEQLGSHSYFFF